MAHYITSNTVGDVSFEPDVILEIIQKGACTLALGQLVEGFQAEHTYKLMAIVAEYICVIVYCSLRATL